MNPRLVSFHHEDNCVSYSLISVTSVFCQKVNINCFYLIEQRLKIRPVAHDSDLDVENLRKYIKGKQEMKISTMIKIARALEVEIGELFEGIK